MTPTKVHNILKRSAARTPVNAAIEGYQPRPEAQKVTTACKMTGLKSEARSLKPKVSAYVDGLRMLGRRDLSEAQIRQRLARKGHEPDEVEAAVDRLRAERAIDDARVAEAIAHTETTVRRHGKLRVRRQIEQAGIAPATARNAVDSVFEALDDQALLEASLGKRLRGRETIADEREFGRLFRYLVGQGFEPDRVMTALRKHKPSRF
jgi:regulatory protein